MTVQTTPVRFSAAAASSAITATRQRSLRRFNAHLGVSNHRLGKLPAWIVLSAPQRRKWAASPARRACLASLRAQKVLSSAWRARVGVSKAHQASQRALRANLVRLDCVIAVHVAVLTGTYADTTALSICKLCAPGESFWVHSQSDELDFRLLRYRKRVARLPGLRLRRGRSYSWCERVHSVRGQELHQNRGRQELRAMFGESIRVVCAWNCNAVVLGVPSWCVNALWLVDHAVIAL